MGTITQSLASIFAIVFSISLVAIQLCSENLSHRLIGLYVNDRNFIFPFLLNLIALVFDLFVLSVESLNDFASGGIILSIVAVLSLMPFFLFTVRLLRPGRVVGKLLNRIKTKDLLVHNYEKRSLYRDNFQAIEDIISICTGRGDYATSQDLIERVREKMYSVLSLMNKEIDKKAGILLAEPLHNMSAPFARLLRNIAVSANKKDAIEITVYTIATIVNYVETFRDARFAPAYVPFDEALERILSQARQRFSSEEFASDKALLELIVANARLSFSKFVK